MVSVKSGYLRCPELQILNERDVASVNGGYLRCPELQIFK